MIYALLAAVIALLIGAVASVRNGHMVRGLFLFVLVIGALMTYVEVFHP